MKEPKNSNSTDKVRMDEFVAKVIPDPGNHQALTLVQGFVGASAQENHIRVYSDSSLNSYIEISLDAVVHSQPLAAEESPLGGSYLWVRTEAEFSYGTPAAQQQTKSSFLEGELYNNYVNTYGYSPESDMAAQAPGVNALNASVNTPCAATYLCNRVSLNTPCIRTINQPICNLVTRFNQPPCVLVTRPNVPPCNRFTISSRCCPIPTTTITTTTFPTTTLPPTPPTPTFTPQTPFIQGNPGQAGFGAAQAGTFNPYNYPNYGY